MLTYGGGLEGLPEMPPDENTHTAGGGGVRRVGVSRSEGGVSDRGGDLVHAVHAAAAAPGGGGGGGGGGAAAATSASGALPDGGRRLGTRLEEDASAIDTPTAAPLPSTPFAATLSPEGGGGASHAAVCAMSALNSLMTPGSRGLRPCKPQQWEVCFNSSVEGWSTRLLYRI
jgi:hypothetical protein